MGILLTADPVAAGGSIGMIVTLGIYALVFGGMWFFFMRPQKKEQKRMASMISALEIGDCILTTGGFIGIVIDRKSVV